MSRPATFAPAFRLLASPLLAASVFAAAADVAGQSILTLAGGGSADGSARSVSVVPAGMTVAPNGDVIIADAMNNRVRALGASGNLSTIAGSGAAGAIGNGGPASQAQLNAPVAVAYDSLGNLYVAEQGGHRVRRVATNGTISIFAGSTAGNEGFSGDGGSATSALLRAPQGIAVDAAGNVYIADTGNHRIRRVSPSGIITTIAGTGSSGFGGDGQPATSAALNRPQTLAIDGGGGLLIADAGNNRIRRVDLASGTIATVAGGGSNLGDGGPATSASLNLSQFSSTGFVPGLVADSTGNVVVGDFGNNRVRRIDGGSRVITTIAGNGDYCCTADGANATSTPLGFPSGLAVDRNGDLVIGSSATLQVFRLSRTSGSLNWIAGNRSSDYNGDGMPAASATFSWPVALAFDNGGNLLVSDTFNDRIRRVALPAGTIATIAGVGERSSAIFGGDGGPATLARFSQPNGIAVDSSGNVYVGDAANNRIRRIDTNGVVTTIAGSGGSGNSGDGGPATAATMNTASFGSLRVALDGRGSLFFSDPGNHRVRRVDLASGIVTAFAGNGSSGFSGDGGPATAASLNQPVGIATDSAGNLYIADSGNSRIRRVNASNGVITTVAGNGSFDFGGDGGPATSASLNRPWSVRIAPWGDLHIADFLNGRIRKVGFDGRISTVAGGPGQGNYAGDNGPATSASLHLPTDIAFDSGGHLYIADSRSKRVRVVYNCVSLAAPFLVSPADGATVDPATPLKWDEVNGAFSYDVYLDTASASTLVRSVNFSTMTPFTVPPNRTVQVSQAGLQPGTRYSWRVVAKGDATCASTSQSSSVTRSFTTTGQVPSAPPAKRTRVVAPPPLLEMAGRAEIVWTMPLDAEARAYYQSNPEVVTENVLTLTSTGLAFPAQPAGGYVVTFGGQQSMVMQDGTFRVRISMPSATYLVTTGTIAHPDGGIALSFTTDFLRPADSGITPPAIVIPLELSTGDTGMSQAAANDHASMHDTASTDFSCSAVIDSSRCQRKCDTATNSRCCLDFDGNCTMDPPGLYSVAKTPTNQADVDYCGGWRPKAQFVGSTCAWWSGLLNRRFGDTSLVAGTAPCSNEAAIRGPLSGLVEATNQKLKALYPDGRVQLVRIDPLGPSCYNNHRGRICQKLDATTLGLQLEAGPVSPNLPVPDPRKSALPERTIVRAVEVPCGGTPIALNLHNNTWWNYTTVTLNNSPTGECAAGGSLSRTGNINHFDVVQSCPNPVTLVGCEFTHTGDKQIVYTPPSFLASSCNGRGTDVVKAEAAGLERIVRINVNCGPAAQLTVTKSGTGLGSVTSTPAGIQCLQSCPSASASFALNSEVTLEAAPAPGSAFTGWTGACTGSTTRCTIRMDASKSVNAIFASGPYALLVGKSGSGSGAVTSQPSGINCGASCSALFDSGTSVTLTASPDSGSTFASWSGACSGTSTTCTIAMNGDKAVTATFNTSSPSGGAPPTLAIRFDQQGDPRSDYVFGDYTDPDGDAKSIEFTTSAYAIYRNPAGDRQSGASTGSGTVTLTNGSAGSRQVTYWYVGDPQIAHARSRGDTAITQVTHVEAQAVDAAGRKSPLIVADHQITVSMQSILVTIEPLAVTIKPGATQQFTATVSGTSNTSVTWNASGGTISSTGLYTAPATEGTYYVYAAAVADPNAYSDSAVITVSQAASASIAGTWKGTYTLNQNVSAFCPNPTITHSGNLTVNFTQNGTTLGGTGTAGGIRDTCSGGGNQTFSGSVAGQISGASITGSINFGNPDLIVNSLSFSGTVNGNQITGTLSIPNNGGSGNFTINKQ